MAAEKPEIEKEINAPIIKIEKGFVKGKISENILGGEYYSFQGMRYAQPPLGNLRFKAPVEVEPWEGVFDATEEGNACISPARSGTEMIGSEDCLFVNVYTNKLPIENEKPQAVMFWVYGGGWNRGSGSSELFSPDYLLKKDVVIVTFNYRLGLLGVASFENPEIDVPGNANLKDIIGALNWVKNNITYFNGDPNNVTIFSSSSGGISVNCLLGSPLMQGLYHKVIIMSGTNGLGGDEEMYTKKNHKFAKQLGFESNDEWEIYKFLLEQPAEKLVEAGELLLKENRNRFLRTYDPVLEIGAKSEKLAFTETQEAYLAKRQPNPVPMMIGSTSEDGILFCTEIIADKVLPPTINEPMYLVPLHFNVPRDSEKAKMIAKKIQTFYYGDETPTYKAIQTFIKLQTDIKYRMTAKRYIKAFKKFSPEIPLYYYRFSLDSPMNLYKKIYGVSDLKGAGHGDELTYIFHTKYTQKFPKGSIEELTMLRMVTFWTNFAKNGDPNPPEPVSYIKTKWHPVEENKYNHLDIGRVLRHINLQPDNDRMVFWDKLHEELGVDYIPL